MTFELRYVGERFDDARLPLDVVSDLPAFRDLVVAYAKEKWRARNQHRQRLPRGFAKSISFDLISIEKGSAKPKLDWRRTVAHQMLPDMEDELEILVKDSYDEIVNLIDGAGSGKFPSALSSEHIRALNRLGSGLREREQIEFVGSSGENGKVVYLDSHRRKNLITRVQETYQTRYEGVGTLIGNHLEGYIELNIDHQGEVRLPVDAERIRAEFDGNIGSDVQCSFEVEVDSNECFKKVVSVYDVYLIDPEKSESLKRCQERLERLLQLEPGWYNGDGAKISRDAVERAKEFASLFQKHADLYRLFPTEEGGVLIEFEDNGWDCSIEILPSGEICIYGVEIDGDRELPDQTFPGLDERFRATVNKIHDGSAG